MRHPLTFLTLILLLCLISPSGAADILFLSFNQKSKSEIDAARAGAKARGEKLIVLPDPPDQKPGAGISELWLEKELRSLNQSGVQFTSVVMSGHDGNGKFTGDNGDLTSKAIREAFSKVPGSGDNIRSLFLAGCYTANAGSLDVHWKGIFPNLGVVGGYDGRAPLADKPAGHYFIEDFLKKEKSLTEARDKAALQKAFKKLKGVQQLHASVFNCSDLYVDNQTASTLEELMESCEKIAKTDQPTRWSERFNCYLLGEAGCEEVPKDTTGGELREIYEDVQKHAHCLPYFEKNGVAVPHPENILYLLFYKQVAENGAKIYAGDLKKYDQLIEELGFPEDLKLGDLASLSRAEVTRRIIEVSKLINQKNKEPADLRPPQGEKIIALWYQTNQIESTFRLLHSSCVPFNWVEPKSSAKSKCMNEASEGFQRETYIQHYEYSLVKDAELASEEYRREFERAKARFDSTMGILNQKPNTTLVDTLIRRSKEEENHFGSVASNYILTYAGKMHETVQAERKYFSDQKITPPKDIENKWNELDQLYEEFAAPMDEADFTNEE